MSTKVITTGYTPRPFQKKLHQSLKRFNVIVAHRRFGKTIFCINEMIDQALRFNKIDKSTGKPFLNPRFAYLAPLYGQAKRVAWDALKQFTANIPGVTTNEADLRVDFPHNGARFTLLGADNPASLKGIYLDGVILDEYAEMSPVAWREVIRPTLSDRGGWAIFIGTPKGQNSFYDLYTRAASQEDPEWFGALFKASDTNVISEAELQSAKNEMTEEEYAQEFECSFNAGLVGAYFAKELTKAEQEGRITTAPHDPTLPVDTYWDLGINDMTAVWFVQTLRGTHKLIDYYEISGASIGEVLSDIRKKNYNLGEFVLPHDAKARDFSTGKSQEQIFYSLGARPLRIIPRVGTKRDSINAARMILGKCIFDAVKCKQGLKALSNYQKKWNAKNNTFEDSPLHNWASNGADAFQQFALGAGEDSRGHGTHARSSITQLQAETSYNPYG